MRCMHHCQRLALGVRRNVRTNGAALFVFIIPFLFLAYWSEKSINMIFSITNTTSNLGNEAYIRRS